jgi:hypothetical protein
MTTAPHTTRRACMTHARRRRLQVPTWTELNRVLARSEEELATFERLDREHPWPDEGLGLGEVPRFLGFEERQVRRGCRLEGLPSRGRGPGRAPGQLPCHAPSWAHAPCARAVRLPFASHLLCSALGSPAGPPAHPPTPTPPPPTPHPPTRCAM